MNKQTNQIMTTDTVSLNLVVRTMQLWLKQRRIEPFCNYVVRSHVYLTAVWRRRRRGRGRRRGRERGARRGRSGTSAFTD